MKQKHLVFPFLMLVLLLVACRKNAVNELNGNEGLVYITEHDSTANFNNFQTFRIADSVSVIQNGKLIKREKSAYDSSFINAIAEALIARGFTRQQNMSVKPDIGVNVSVISSSYTGVVSYDDYWGYYDSYWDPYYWGYSGYNYYFPYSFGYYTYQEGAVSVDMVDLKNPDSANNRLHTLWTGLIRGTGIFNAANINEMVQSLFNQSTYIQQ